MFHWTSFLNNIILLGIIQGFLLSGILSFTPANRHPSNRLLAVLILLLATASLNIYSMDQDWLNSNIVLRILSRIFPLVVVMPMGPLLYFYTRSSLDSGFRLSRRQRLHFYPVLLDLLPYSVVLFFDVLYMFNGIGSIHHKAMVFVDYCNMYSDIPRWISLTAYAWCAKHYLHRHPNEGDTGTRRWLHQLITAFLAFQVIWFLFLVPYVTPAWTAMLLHTVGWYPIFIPFTLLIYWLGIKIYLRPQTTPVMAEKKNTGALTLTTATVKEVAGRLQKAMTEELLYLDPALSLASLSGHTGISSKTVSVVLNQHLSQSFTEFVNSYRVEEFKKRALRCDLAQLTISGMAQECGFNSLATFQRTFKQLTGMSPTIFLQQA